MGLQFSRSLKSGTKGVGSFQIVLVRCTISCGTVWFDVPTYLYTRSEFKQIAIPIARNTIELMSWERQF
ncbi:hypothetical protein HanRHA438_Chr06g0266631 [Helianthus annuus]|nr:hypothetical protein HanRHA438_Chr06g0266631 [Helianthus annuus]